ncbi:hypothetical protein [Salinispora sp. H7-4]|uniref:hypothetical protein n=1 Tax=Salinispora sp. H7-4 TaxID=2748321 RepID=UPI0015D20290|nr:hypothetical protein [Salinispora sp. H7-4]NYT96764.1 hypothetical protein [Salinispora sp. H7-4]
MTAQDSTFRGFANPVDPSSAELRAWAYQPDSVPLAAMPQDWDLLVAGNGLVTTLFDLAMDPACPARRFALHCLYIYAAGGIRSGFRAHPKRRFWKLVERAEREGDEPMRTWAQNSRILLAQPDVFVYRDWCEGGLVRENRRLP